MEMEAPFDGLLRLHVRWGNPPHVTSPTLGPPPSCKQALKLVGISVNINKTLRLAKEFCCFVTTVKPLLSGHSTELTIVVLDYVLGIRTVVD